MLCAGTFPLILSASLPDNEEGLKLTTWSSQLTFTTSVPSMIRMLPGSG